MDATGNVQLELTLEARKLQRKGRGPRPGSSPENAVRAINRGKEIRVIDEIFRISEKKITSRVQSIVKNGDESVLKRRGDINQDIAAGDQVHAGKRRVRDDVLLGEEASFAEAFFDLKAIAYPDEELL